MLTKACLKSLEVLTSMVTPQALLAEITAQCICSMSLFSLNNDFLWKSFINLLELAFYQLYISSYAVFYCFQNEIIITRYPVIFNFPDETGQVLEKKLGTGQGLFPVYMAEGGEIVIRSSYDDHHCSSRREKGHIRTVDGFLGSL